MYRNYFADTNGEIGQSAGNQLNNLGDLLDHVGPTAKDFLKVKNGYVWCGLLLVLVLVLVYDAVLFAPCYIQRR